MRSWCWFFAVSAGQLWLGLPLVLALQCRLHSCSIALGIGVGYARNLAERWWGESRTFEKIVRVLPRISAVLITAMGLWLSFAAVHWPGKH